MTSADRPDALFTKAEPINITVDKTRLANAKIELYGPDTVEELPEPFGINNPVVRQVIYSTKHLEACLDEAKRQLPDRFKTDGEPDIYKMVAGYHNEFNAAGREYRLENSISKNKSAVSIVGTGRPIGLSFMPPSKINERLLMEPRLLGDRLVSIDAIKAGDITEVYPRNYAIYNMIDALETPIGPAERAMRWQKEVRQLVTDWFCLPVRTKRGDRLAREVSGMLHRRIASGSIGRSDRGLVSRMRSTLTMGKIANELIAVAAELSNGDSAAVMTASGTHCVFFLANPEGSFVGICEMSEKLPAFVDGVPDYLYYAVISAIGWRGMNSIPHHLEGIIRKAMSFGGFSNDAFIQLEIVNHPEYVTKMPEHYALGCITMDEVTRGVESPNTRPILIK